VSHRERLAARDGLQGGPAAGRPRRPHRSRRRHERRPRRVETVVPDGLSDRATASCETGETAVGGGAGLSGAQIDDRAIFYSEPREADGSIPESGDPATAWSAGGINQSGAPQTVNVFVLCASA